MKFYYMLTKPGIILGNLLTTAAGFALASGGHFDVWLFLMTAAGLALIIGSACVFNNYVDRHSDAKMERTKDRILVVGLVSLRGALIFASVLGVVGTATLLLFSNLLTAAIALFGFFAYALLYTFGKYRSSYGTLVGSVAGAVPPLAGYCAVSGHLDLGAMILFAIIVLWQMPHFYAIAVYRLDDYVAAAIPVLPATRGIPVTKVHMALYVFAFLIATLMLAAFGYTGYIYLIVAALSGLAWLGLCFRGIKASSDDRWARQMFRLSLVIILLLTIAISFDHH
jgi:heme o synthase